MKKIRLTAQVKEDRQLIIDLPFGTPLGEVEIIIKKPSQIKWKGILLGYTVLLLIFNIGVRVWDEVHSEPDSKIEQSNNIFTRNSDLAEVVDKLYSSEADTAVFSSDGQYLAWGEVGSLCIYHVVEDTKTCHELPEGFLGFPISLTWSPTGEEIAFTENHDYESYYDSDLWTFSLENGQIQNLTDDGVTGQYWDYREDVLEYHYDLDMFPFYHPVTQELYFIHLEHYRNRETEESYSKITLHGFHEGSIEFYADLSDSIEYLNTDLPPIITSDGKNLLMWSYKALWLFDLDTKTARQVIEVDDLWVYLPRWVNLEEFRYVSQSMLANEDQGVIIKMLFFENDPLSEYFVYVDLASGETQPIFEYQQLEKMGANEYWELDEMPESLAGMPTDLIVSHDGKQAIYFREGRAFDNTTVSMLALPPEGHEPIDIETFGLIFHSSIIYSPTLWLERYAQELE